MSLTEQEIEQLESYLDGELTTDEEESLRQRMTAEPALAAAMETARAECATRLAVWKSYEPSEAAIKRLLAHVDAGVDRNTAWTYRLSNLRIGAAAAACIVFGILVGRVGRGTGDLQNTDGPTIARLDQPGYGQPLPPTGSPTMVAQQLEFPIVNEFGQPVAVQRFNSVREANEFFEDLHRWQKAQEQIRNGGGMIVPASERF